MIFHGIHEFSEFLYFREFKVLYLQKSAGPSRIPANSLNFPGLRGNCQAVKKFLAVHLSTYLCNIEPGNFLATREVISHLPGYFSTQAESSMLCTRTIFLEDLP
jgi:hypothetical protein